jgi:hypothetical protein
MPSVTGSPHTFRAFPTINQVDGLPHDNRSTRLERCYWITYPIAGLLLLAAGGGLFFHAYRDNLWVRSQLRGQDFVSLVFALPLLLVSVHFARRGSIRGLLTWLGGLGYVTYSYLYIFGIAWNRLFLVYLALALLSAFTLIRALIALDAPAIALRFSTDVPTKAVERYLMSFGVALGALWGIQAISATVTGGVPQSVIDSGHPTGVVFILDLGLIVPLFIWGARLLHGSNPWGFVAAGILLVKGVAEGLALLGMALFMYLDHYPTIDSGLIPLWALVAILSSYFSIRYLRSIPPAGAAFHSPEGN